MHGSSVKVSFWFRTFLERGEVFPFLYAKDLDVFVSISRNFKQKFVYNEFVGTNNNSFVTFRLKLRYRNVCIPGRKEFNQWHRRIPGWWRESLINIFKQCMLYTCRLKSLGPPGLRKIFSFDIRLHSSVMFICFTVNFHHFLFTWKRNRNKNNDKQHPRWVCVC